MYFKSRAEAGERLAQLLSRYRYENTAILALSAGGVMTAEPIARALHSTLAMLLTQPIELAALGGAALGVVDQAGTFTYNSMIPIGTLEETASEMRNVIEQEKMQKFFEISRILGEKGMVDKNQLYGRNVILVNDGLKSGLALEAAVNFLKPIRIERLIGAVPLASVPAVDKLHLSCDEIHVLNVIDGDFDVNHYYEDNQLADPNQIMDSINQVITKWA